MVDNLRTWNSSYAYDWDVQNILLFDGCLPKEWQRANDSYVINPISYQDGGHALRKALEEYGKAYDRLLCFVVIESPVGARENGILGTHAVALIIDNKQHKIFYQDPHGFGIDERRLTKGNTYKKKELAHMTPLASILKELFPDYKIIESKTDQQKNDLLNCATITINNIKCFARDGKFPKTCDVEKVRAEHKEIVLSKIASLVASETIEGLSAQFTIKDKQKSQLHEKLATSVKAYYTEKSDDTFLSLSEPSWFELSDIGKATVGNLVKLLTHEQIICASEAVTHAARASDEPVQAKLYLSRLDRPETKSRIAKAIHKGQLVSNEQGASLDVARG